MTDRGTLLVLDCGTGVRLLGDALLSENRGPMRGHIFLTHTHWDHIQGFPFFAPAFVPSNEWMIYGPADGVNRLEEALSGQMQYTYFPVELDRIGATLECRDLGEGEFQLDDVHVMAHYLNHPAVTLGYRFEVGGSSLVYCTDHEPFSPTLFRDGTRELSADAIVHAGDRKHSDFLADADLVIHDAQYTTEEYPAKRNWGHSTVDYVIQIAIVSRVKKLALFHHDPKHDDNQLDEIGERARSLVKELGGNLEVFVAREGQTVELAEDNSISQGLEERPRGPVIGRKHRILIVDDDEMIRTIVREILFVDGYTLETSGDGEEALARIAANPPDLVLMDLRLPTIDGFEVLRRIRSSTTTATLPVIMLTSASDAERTERGFNAGANDYMVKPFSPAQLRARISEWLHRTDAGVGKIEQSAP